MKSVFLNSHTKYVNEYDQSNFVGYKIKLYPTESQIHKFNEYFGACRFIYNYCVNLQEEWLKQVKDGDYKTLTYFKYSDEIIKLRNTEKHSWLKQYNLESLRYIARDVVFAYSLYLNTNHNRPKFKTKKNYKQSFPVRSDRLSIEKDFVKIPSIGYVYIKNAYFSNIIGSMVRKNTTYIQYIGARIIYDGCDYYLTFRLHKSENTQTSSYKKYSTIFYTAKQKSNPIGIDIGCSKNNWIVRSNGDITCLPDVAKEEKKISLLHSKFMHKYKINGEKTNRQLSRNESKLLYRINKYSKKIMNKIKNEIYCAAHSIMATKPEYIVLEDINVKDMLMSKEKCRWEQKKINAFNHNILLHMPYTVKNIITEVANTANIPVIIADRQYKSSQICSNCRNYYPVGSNKIYRCPHCGFTINRDINAAINLSRYTNKIKPFIIYA